MDAKIWTKEHSAYDSITSIDVMIEAPKVDNTDVWVGGKFIMFQNDYAKNECKAYRWHYAGGVQQIDWKYARKWKGENLTEEECLKYAEELCKLKK